MSDDHIVMASWVIFFVTGAMVGMALGWSMREDKYDNAKVDHDRLMRSLDDEEVHTLH